MVKDNVTGLIWENNGHDDSTWYDAPTVIASLNTSKFGGYSDWRLPTMTELGSIVDFSIPYPGPTINTNMFKDTFISFYWSSSTYANAIGYAWGVGFYDGLDDHAYKHGASYVRAVRAGQSIIRSFDPLVINGDRIVSDNTTGLMWQQDTAKTATGGTTMVWKDALSYCENLTLGGYTDWRLPTIKELRSIVDYTVYSPAIDTSAFKDTFASFYWSSSTNAHYIKSAWGIEFGNGDGDDYTKKGGANYVRAVRAGQSVIGSLDNLILSVFPATRNVSQNSGNAVFTVLNTGTGTGTMNWNASVSSGSSWLRITSGAGGSNRGTISCEFDANATSSERKGIITVTATGATGSPKDITVIQAAGTKPTVTTGIESSITETSATLTGRLNPNGISTTYYFEYGKTTGYGLQTPAADGGSGTTVKSLSYNIIGLTANTTYHFRLVAINSMGTTYGDDRPFITKSTNNPVLSVSPEKQNVSNAAGTTTFDVSNTGTGTMPWTAAVTSVSSWLKITSGQTGSDRGTISCVFDKNTTTSARTGTITVTATGATVSSKSVTVTQAAGTAQAVLTIYPLTRPVAKTAGTTTFDVSNTGTGTMTWTAVVTSGSSWLRVTSGSSGSSTGTISCAYDTNTTTSERRGIIRVTATGATGSPKDVTVTQAAGSSQAVLSISPLTRLVANTADTTTFAVSNTGTGTMTWTAVVTSGSSWLRVTSGSSGSNAATISCAYDTNTTTSARTGTITVTATGATVSSKSVTVTQAAGVVVSKPPTLGIGTTTSITGITATLNGTVNPNGAATTCYFKYGTTTAYGKVTTTQSNGSGTTAVPVSAALTGLIANTTYHYQLVATNSAGTTSGVDKTFTTLSTSGTKPAVVTGVSSSVTAASATLNGTVNPNGAATTCYFQYGLTTAYGKVTTTQSKGFGTANVAVSAALNGLTANTTYNYRVVAANSAGKTYGVNKTFTTLSIEKPIISVSPATQNVVNTSGTTTFSVSNTGAGTMAWTAAVTSGGSWLKITSGSSGSSSANSEVNTRTISCAFDTNTTTSVRTGIIRVTAIGATGSPKDVKVTQDAGVTFGIPVVSTGSATSITGTTATLTGTLNPNGLETTYYFLYIQSEYYVDYIDNDFDGDYILALFGGMSTAQSSSGASSFTVTANINELTPNTNYSYWIVAVNSVGEVKGAVRTFTTKNQ